MAVTVKAHTDFAKLRVAIVHYWFIDWRGGEKVIQAICDLFPQADLFSNVADRRVFADLFSRRKVTTTFINRLPWSKSKQKIVYYLPLMPFALEQLDLRDYDLVISSESGPAKNLVLKENCLHLCYCHAPMRYCWNMYADYLEGLSPLLRLPMSLAAHYLRLIDYASAARVDYFVANSTAVAKRIAKYYRRSSSVVFPPVETKNFADFRTSEVQDYFLYCGQLIDYKRADLAVKCFNETGQPLLVVGTGELLPRLRAQAKSNIKFLGWVPDEELRRHLAGCRALIFPGEEDFGMVPVEAMAAGRPVIAFGQGGALDTVVDGETGILFNEQTTQSLKEALKRFTEMESRFDRNNIVAHALRFDTDVFKRNFSAVLRRALHEQEASRFGDTRTD